MENIRLLDIKGVGEKTLLKLGELGIDSVQGLIEFLPKNYLDMTKISSINEIVEGEFALLKVNILNVQPKRYSSNHICYIKCDAECENFKLTLIWFNMPYMEYTLSCGEFLVWGMVKYDNGRYTLINPSVSTIENKYKLKDVTPIYPLKGKIGEVSFRKIMENALEKFSFDNLLPKMFDLNKIYTSIHFPKTMKEMRLSQYYLALYELVVQLLCYKKMRKTTENAPLKIKYPHFVDSILPFSLTQSQQQAIENIIADLNEKTLMNRLILGDVGSGKTIVAFYAMIMVALQGGQCVLLAPTEILVNQHYNKFKKLFADIGLQFDILTSGTILAKQDEIKEKLANGSLNILFSTHSCLSDKIKIPNLKLAVIDEAHKFGVKQKAVLQAKSQFVNCLLMSATPVPRAMAMVLFGDLKISKLYKAEGLATNIKTYCLRSNKLFDMFNYFAKKIQTGSQVIVVCPRVVDNSGADIYSARSMFKELSNTCFKDIKVGLLYGGMKNDDKIKVMQAFDSGEIKVLVSTTVVEVGIDVPNVDTIAIIGSDRFGIATLHQLRGRVGRDGREAECYLHTATFDIPERIKKMQEISDGLRLAELDAKMRGYGDFIGFNQSGGNSFDRFKIKITESMIKLAKKIVDTIDMDNLDEKVFSMYLDKYYNYKDVIMN